MSGKKKPIGNSHRMVFIRNFFCFLIESMMLLLANKKMAIPNDDFCKWFLKRFDFPFFMIYISVYVTIMQIICFATI